MKLNRINSRQLLDTQDAVKRKAIIDQLETDELTKDALDGFLHSEISWTDVQQMDDRYKHERKGNFTFKWIIGGASMVILIVGLVIFYQINQPSTNQLVNHNYSKTTEPSKNKKDNLQTSNSNLVKAKSNNEVQLQARMANTSSLNKEITINEKEINSVVSSEIISDGSLKSMKVLDVKMFNSSDEIKNEGVNAQEVFIYSYKTVDYRVYRKENTLIVDANRLLNGVSANQSSKSSTVEISEQKEIGYFYFLTESMNYFKKGMLDLAMENFNLILKNFPDDVNALFYAGLCAVEKKDYKNSIAFFENVRIHKYSNFREEAEWKLLDVLIQTKDWEKAKSLRQTIIQKNGFYAGQAKALKI